jgi:mRNA-degrading endonuclease YafQ of YafQ-DinJ toxin-antitoxin module
VYKRISAASLKCVLAFLYCTLLAGLLIASLILEQQQCDLKALWCNIRNHHLKSDFLQIFDFPPSFDLVEFQQELKPSHHVDKITVFPQRWK